MTPGPGGRVAPFTLPLVDCGEASLEGLLHGSLAAVIVFWSGVCSHCRRYDNFLGTLASRYPGLALLAVACRKGESFADISSARAERDLAFPIAFDGERRIARAWLVEQTPRAFLVDAGGRMRYRGAIDNFKYPNDPRHEAYLEAAIESVLRGRPVSRPETPGFGCAIDSVYYDMPTPYARGS